MKNVVDTRSSEITQKEKKSKRKKSTNRQKGFYLPEVTVTIVPLPQ